MTAHGPSGHAAAKDELNDQFTHLAKALANTDRVGFPEWHMAGLPIVLGPLPA